MDDKILKEKSNRIFFLKAILLGIEYSESGKGIELKNTIKSELFKLQNENNNNLNQNNNSSNSFNPLNSSEQFSKDNYIIQNGKMTLQKYEQILHELNAQKLNISNKISNTSSQSYMKTLSLQQSQQIQKELFSLKKMQLIVNKEIEKYSLLHQSVFKMTLQPKISPQENIMKKNNNKNYLNPSLNNYNNNNNNIEKIYNNNLSNLSENNYNQNNNDFSNQPFFYKNQENTNSQSSSSTIKSKSVSFFPPDNNEDESNSPSSNSFMNNNIENSNYENDNDDNDDSKDLLKELQRTFGNLSSLLNSN
jgi:hypothetical protein